jgi:hypothetical protein
MILFNIPVAAPPSVEAAENSGGKSSLFRDVVWVCRNVRVSARLHDHGGVLHRYEVEKERNRRANLFFS